MAEIGDIDTSVTNLKFPSGALAIIEHCRFYSIYILIVGSLKRNIIGPLYEGTLHMVMIRGLKYLADLGCYKGEMYRLVEKGFSTAKLTSHNPFLPKIHG